MNTKIQEEIVVDEIGKDNTVKANGFWHNISKFSAFKDFKVGESYKVEVEHYEYNGFLRRRILRIIL
jgi:hypothetical protein